MASISANGAKGNHKFTLTVTEKSTSVDNNTSSLEFSFVLSPVYTSWNWEQWGSSISYKVTINGTDYTGSIPAYDGYSTVTLKSGTQTVSHNADGSKTISYSFTVTDGAGQRYTPGNASASGSYILTTIPRATTPKLSATSITANGTNSVTITLEPASSTFKHKVRYDFGSLKGYVSGFLTDGKEIGWDFTAQGKSVTVFTPGTWLLNEIPSVNSDVCTIYVYTYTSSGTHVGTKSVNLTINVPSYTPSISGINLVGNNLLSGAYVQGKSTVTATITASSSYGAAIKTYSSTVDGKTYTGSKFTSSALSNGENKNVSVTVTDTRGKTATLASSAFTVYAYSAPSISSFTVERQSDETTVVAKVKGTVSSVNNKNAKNITVTLNGVTQSITSTEYSINGSTTFTGVPTDNTLTATAKIADSYTDATKDAVLPTVAVTMDFHYSGKGIAFGKVAEDENKLDVNWDIYCRKGLSLNGTTFGPLTINRTETANGASVKFVNTNGTLGYVGMANEVNSGLKRWTADTKTSYTVLDTGNTKDYVIEQGTSNGWEYTKWANGKIELFAEKSLSFPAGTKQTDYLYRSIVQIDFSGLLKNIWSGTCGVQVNGMVPQFCRHSETHTLAEIVIVTSRTFTAFTQTTPIYVIGKWK